MQISMVTYLKQNVWVNLGEVVVMEQLEKINEIFFTLHFTNFFNSPRLFHKLFKKSIYGVGAVRSNWKDILRLKDVTR